MVASRWHCNTGSYCATISIQMQKLSRNQEQINNFAHACSVSKLVNIRFFGGSQWFSCFSAMIGRRRGVKSISSQPNFESFYFHEFTRTRNWFLNWFWLFNQSRLNEFQASTCFLLIKLHLVSIFYSVSPIHLWRTVNVCHGKICSTNGLGKRTKEFEGQTCKQGNCTKFRANEEAIASFIMFMIHLLIQSCSSVDLCLLLMLMKVCRRRRTFNTLSGHWLIFHLLLSFERETSMKLCNV